MNSDTGRKSAIVKRSIVIKGHKTSLSLEDEFWIRLKELATASGGTLSNYVENIDIGRTNANLSSALRVHILGKVADELAHIKSLYGHDTYAVAPGLTITAKTAVPSNDFAQA